MIGGGPAGLIAADLLSAAGRPVTVYDRMPSLGRKFLMQLGTRSKPAVATSKKRSAPTSTSTPAKRKRR
ncbi:NAD(P)/FAD-dependent oxidoreductase [Citrobacter braakii]|nr:NAD(P)/FAD-dependent oxidoreductase [Citrobacter braakii]